MIRAAIVAALFVAVDMSTLTAVMMVPAASFGMGVAVIAAGVGIVCSFSQRYLTAHADAAADQGVHFGCLQEPGVPTTCSLTVFPSSASYRLNCSERPKCWKTSPLSYVTAFLTVFHPFSIMI